MTQFKISPSLVIHILGCVLVLTTYRYTLRVMPLHAATKHWDLRQTFSGIQTSFSSSLWHVVKLHSPTRQKGHICSYAGLFSTASVFHHTAFLFSLDATCAAPAWQSFRNAAWESVSSSLWVSLEIFVPSKVSKPNAKQRINPQPHLFRCS